MTTFAIGREPDLGTPHIRIEHKSVSRKHATLAEQGAGAYLLTDVGSSHGTFLQTDKGWRRITGCMVGLNDKVRFGKVITGIGDLLSRAETSAELPGAPVSITIERNPTTGEIIKTKK